MATVPKQRRTREIRCPTRDGKPMADSELHMEDMIDTIQVLRASVGERGRRGGARGHRVRFVGFPRDRIVFCLCVKDEATPIPAGIHAYVPCSAHRAGGQGAPCRPFERWAALPLSPRLASGHAKTQVEVPVHRRDRAPERRPLVGGGVAPAPAPTHADGNPCCARRIDSWRLDVVFLISIPAPLPDISMHVE